MCCTAAGAARSARGFPGRAEELQQCVAAERDAAGSHHSPAFLNASHRTPQASSTAAAITGCIDTSNRKHMIGMYRDFECFAIHPSMRDLCTEAQFHRSIQEGSILQGPTSP